MGSELFALCDSVQNSGTEKLLYIVLGAILALLGGFLTQKYQNHILKGREDRELLLKALDILIDLGPSLNDFPASHSDVIKPCNELLYSARRIQTRHYYGLAEKLIEFAKKDVKHTREESNKLIDEIAEEISKPYYGYNRKEKEFFKELAKEMREELEREKKKGG